MKCVERQRLEKVKLKKTIKHSSVPEADVCGKRVLVKGYKTWEKNCTNKFEIL